MKNKKRMLAMGLSLAMVAASLYGCGGTASESTESETETAEEVSEEEPAAEEESEAEETEEATEEVSSNLEKIDMASWQYEADDDVYWQVGYSYAETPADESYETMGFYVPGAYFDGEDNGDGTYTCVKNTENAVGNYTAETAPIIVPVNTPGYAAMDAPTGYDASFGYGSVKDYTDAGMVMAICGARGRNEGAPSGVVDFKAAIRYTRYNADELPGNMDAIFSEGMSGGGAQSALIGSTGNSELYDPYLEAIGAVSGVSDAVFGSMCWCPITNLDYADEAYEWNMGMTRTDLSEEDSAVSDALAASYLDYINGAVFEDEEGNAMTLELNDEGKPYAGSYYDYILSEVERSLNNFLSDTEFPYDADAASSGGPGGGMGGPGGGMGGPRGGMGGPGDGEGGPGEGMGQVPEDGQMPEGAPEDMEQPPEGAPGQDAADGQTEGGGQDYEAMDDIARNETTGGVSISGTYETAQDYIDALNADGEWVTYDAQTNTATVSSIADFAKAVKVATKSLGAFDQYDREQGENTLFGYDDGEGAHFDAVLAGILEDLGSEYAADYAEDLQKTDALGTSVQGRMDMYTPLYYLMSSYKGHGSADVAPNWRIRTGAFQGDTSLTTEINLALALKQYGITNVDFETVWGMKHTEAERTGESTENFIAWVNECMQ